VRNLVLAAAVGAASLVAASSSHAAIAYALTDENSLLGFDTSTPTALLSGVPLHTAANLAIEDLIAIDYRPANNTMYGMGKLGAIYAINPITGVATPVSTLSIGLNGSRFGFDFNPVADRLRVVSDIDQNLSVDVTTGIATSQTPLNPANPNITAAAYTNSFSGATSTVLYTIDSLTSSLYTQNPPANGTETLVGSLGIGDISSVNGFDILTSGVAGATAPVNIAYAALQLDGESASRLYTINLATGAATLVGTIGGGDAIDGLTVVAVPEPATLGLLGGAIVLGLRRRGR
jgi:hypothetical protein